MRPTAPNLRQSPFWTPIDTVVIHSSVNGSVARLRWEEHGGPTIAEPQHEGFGSKLIEVSVVRQMGGKIARDWAESGLTVHLEVPATSMRR